MTKAELIAQNKTLRGIIRHFLPGALCAEIGFHKARIEELRKQLKEATRLTPQDRADLAKAKMDRTYELNQKLKEIGVSIFSEKSSEVTEKE